MRYITSLLLLILWVVPSLAQNNSHSDKDYIKAPLWIEMMNDTLSNYFEVEKAYMLYWQHHQMPVAEDEFEGKRGKEKVEKKEQVSLEEMRERNYMAEALKAYKIWHMQMLPFVQDDGRILTPAEQIAAWRLQQVQLKQQSEK
jgi:hypothetical protein